MRISYVVIRFLFSAFDRQPFHPEAHVERMLERLS